MMSYEYYIVFPEGDEQEIGSPLRIDELVDMNGRPLELPLPTPRMVVYRVVKIRKREDKGEEASYHYLELVGAEELLSYCR